MSGRYIFRVENDISLFCRCRFFPQHVSLSGEARGGEGRGHWLSCQFGFISRGKQREEEGIERERKEEGSSRIKRKLLMSLAPRPSFFSP